MKAACETLLSDCFARSNAYDEIILFHSLSKEQLAKIVDVQLEGLAKASCQSKSEVNPDRCRPELLGSEGYDPAYGARPLKRIIQQRMKSPGGQNPFREFVRCETMASMSFIQTGF